jgi:Rieske Fe-S protein
MPLDELRPPRRAVIVGTGLGLAATTLAGCATYGDKPSASSSSSAPGAQSSAAENSPAAAETVLAKTTDVPVGSGVIVDEVVITQPTAGVFKGFSSVCPHRGCNVSEVTEGNIVCPCHGSRFDLEGAVVTGPATEPLASKPISVKGDAILAE